MNKKLSYEEIRKRFEDNGLTLVDKTVKDSYQNLTCYDNEGYYYYFRYCKVEIFTNKSRFNKFNPYTIKNIQHFLDLNHTNLVILSQKFSSKKEKMKFRCGCGNEFDTLWSSVYHRHSFSCPECVKKNNSKKYKFDFVKKILKEHDYILLDNEYKGNTENLTCLNKEGYKVHIKFSFILNNYKKKPYVFSPVFNGENYIYNINNYFKINNINCKALYYQYEKERYSKEDFTVYCKCECGKTFHTNFASIKNGQWRCQSCSKSKSHLEMKAERWLQSKHIYYIYQKKFDDCIGDKRSLPFDFYLPKYNTCIEIDGKQHEECVNFGYLENVDLEEYYNKRRKYDKIKDDYCLAKGIKLIRIKQKDIERRQEKYKEILYNELIKK